MTFMPGEALVDRTKVDSGWSVEVWVIEIAPIFFFFFF